MLKVVQLNIALGTEDMQYRNFIFHTNGYKICKKNNTMFVFSNDC